MKSVELVLVGAIIGGLSNAIGWYGWTVIFTLISTSKLDWTGGWGGNVVVAFIGGIIGLFFGGIVGLFQPTKTSAVICSGVIALIPFGLIMQSFLSGEYAKFYLHEGNYAKVWLECLGFAGVFIISVFVVWIVAKIVLSLSKKY